MGGNKKKNQPPILCEVCRERIKESGGNFMQCPYCRKSVHYNCAVQSNLIATNLFYYCPDHEKNAGQFLNRQPEKQKEVVRTMEAEKSPEVQNEDNGKESKETTTVEPSSLLQSFMSDLESKETTSNEQNSNVNPSDHIKDATMAKKRTINHPAMVIIEEPYNPSCDSCHEKVTDQFFGCRICKKYFHEDCVSESARMNDIEDYWSCTVCLKQWKE
jgi:hypothetical protein